MAEKSKKKKEKKKKKKSKTEAQKNEKRRKEAQDSASVAGNASQERKDAESVVSHDTFDKLWAEENSSQAPSLPDEPIALPEFYSSVRSSNSHIFVDTDDEGHDDLQSQASKTLLMASKARLEVADDIANNANSLEIEKPKKDGGGKKKKKDAVKKKKVKEKDKGKRGKAKDEDATQQQDFMEMKKDRRGRKKRSEDPEHDAHAQSVEAAYKKTEEDFRKSIDGLESAPLSGLAEKEDEVTNKVSLETFSRPKATKRERRASMGLPGGFLSALEFDELPENVPKVGAMRPVSPPPTPPSTGLNVLDLVGFSHTVNEMIEVEKSAGWYLATFEDGPLGLELEPTFEFQGCCVHGFQYVNDRPSPAQEAGTINMGDVIVKVNGDVVKSYDDTIALLKKGGHREVTFRPGRLSDEFVEESSTEGSYYEDEGSYYEDGEAYDDVAEEHDGVDKEGGGEDDEEEALPEPSAKNESRDLSKVDAGEKSKKADKKKKAKAKKRDKKAKKAVKDKTSKNSKKEDAPKKNENETAADSNDGKHRATDTGVDLEMSLTIEDLVRAEEEENTMRLKRPKKSRKQKDESNGGEAETRKSEQGCKKKLHKANAEKKENTTKNEGTKDKKKGTGKESSGYLGEAAGGDKKKKKNKKPTKDDGADATDKKLKTSANVHGDVKEKEKKKKEKKKTTKKQDEDRET
jgi:hypothetical protein